MKLKWTSTFLTIFILLTSCTAPSQPAADSVPTNIPQAGMPNPASAYCEEQGYRLEIRTAADGGQSGYCIFPDGSECDEWAYFRGECTFAPYSPTPPPADLTINGWKTYTDYIMNFSFQYPGDATIQVDGDTVYVTGPIVDKNSWPIFTVSHLGNQADFQFSEGLDLSQWLIDHNLYVGQPQTDREIADTSAIHTRFQEGQQSFANDRYYFAHNNQVFVITILHAGNKEDWTLYNHFLDSFQFTQTSLSTAQAVISTIPPIDPSEYQGWWTYTHTEYGFSLMLPEDWKVEEVTTSDPLMNGHMLNLSTEGLNIRMNFRHTGEDALLWPTGVGAGEFIAQGTLNVAGQPTQRMYFVCPTGEINSIWYHDGDGSPNIQRGNLEFAFIFSLTDFYCEAGHNLDGKSQHVGETIIASLTLGETK